jgi:hypothetical protein
MKRVAFFASCLVLFLVTISIAQQPMQSCVSIVAPGYNLIPNGKIKTGDTLYGLYDTNLGYVLLPSKIEVDSGVDARCRKFMTVVVEDKLMSPLFLVAGLPNLKCGKVKTLSPGHKFLFPGQTFNLTTGGQEAEAQNAGQNGYLMRAFGCAVSRLNKSLIYDYSVKLTHGDQSQILDYYRVKDEQKYVPGEFGVFDVTDHPVTRDLRDNMGLPVLIWAGDVDRDGKPDLFMWWPCPGKDAGVFSLFLSSTAKQGDLVRKVSVGVRLQPPCGQK